VSVATVQKPYRGLAQSGDYLAPTGRGNRFFIGSRMAPARSSAMYGFQDLEGAT